MDIYISTVCPAELDAHKANIPHSLVKEKIIKKVCGVPTCIGVYVGAGAYIYETTKDPDKSSIQLHYPCSSAIWVC